MIHNHVAVPKLILMTTQRSRKLSIQANALKKLALPSTSSHQILTLPKKLFTKSSNSSEIHCQMQISANLLLFCHTNTLIVEEKIPRVPVILRAKKTSRLRIYNVRWVKSKSLLVIGLIIVVHRTYFDFDKISIESISYNLSQYSFIRSLFL